MNSQTMYQKWHNKFWRKWLTRLLIAGLRTKSVEIRTYILQALGKVGDESAFHVILNAARDSNSTIRRFAISALAEWEDTRAVDVLIDALDDSDSDIRVAAVMALGRFREKRVEDALITLLDDEEDSVRAQTVIALGNLRSNQAFFSQSPPIMEIVDLSQMVVKTFINEVDMEKLAVGKKAEIQVRAYSDRLYRGEVREISPSGQSRDNIIYFEVLVAVLGSPKELRPGMTADVDIIVVERKNALLLPVEAVKSDRVMTVLLTIPETDVARLTSRQSVELVLGDDQKFQGTVIRRIPSAEQGNVEIALKDADRSVRPGRTSVDLFSDGDTLSNIPAMLRFGRQYYVMLVPKEEKSEAAKGEAVRGVKRLIEVGEQNDVYMEILGGLSEGDKILVQDTTQMGSGQLGRRR